MRKNTLRLLSFSSVVLAALFTISCGGSGSSSGGGVSTGSVALYITDSPADDYERVKVTINDVHLMHTGTGASCDILGDPIKDIDIKDLSSMLQLVDISTCNATNYNRIHVEFIQQVKLTDISDTTDTCDFTSYKDEGNNPNVLQCNGTSCFIDINGAVNVFASQSNELALDFELKDFEILDFNTTSCSVTIKVSPLHASEIKKKHDDGYNEGISGYITNLDPSIQSFTMTSESGTFNVSYADITGQQNVIKILELAATDQLEVEVHSASINLDGNIDATAIYTEIEGTVSNLDDLITKTFTLIYQTGKIIIVDYQNAEVQGVLVDNANVEVKLSGYDGSNYLSKEVEIAD